jgi:deoxyguanosine kinase
MKLQNEALISLGSNSGNRLENILACIRYIHSHIGTVIKVSGLYETPSWGFESDDFYNCALLVHTCRTAQEILEAIIIAEQQAGRVPSNEQGYQARNIDIDIIAFNDDVIDEPRLVVPHPRMQERNFVLYPLRDIKPDWVHPELNLSIKRLIEAAADDSPCKFISKLAAPLEVFDLSSYNYIAIEGNIGAGKTTLAGKISEDFNAKIVLERFADNPFLPKFYKDQARYAFSLEMSFLADRYQQLSDDLSQFDLFSDFIVADYHIFKSLIFSKVTLSEDEYRLYRKLFDIIYKEMPKPDLYIYLYQNTERLLQHIKQRGRAYEQDINADYLEKINRSYLEYIKSQQDLNVLIIDISEKDFVKNQEDYISILNAINEKLPNVSAKNAP